MSIARTYVTVPGFFAVPVTHAHLWCTYSHEHATPWASRHENTAVIMHVCWDSMLRGMGAFSFSLESPVVLPRRPWMLREHFAFPFKLYNGLMFLRASGVLRNRKTLRRRRMRLFYQHYNSKMIKRVLFTKVCRTALALPYEMWCWTTNVNSAAIKMKWIAISISLAGKFFLIRRIMHFRRRTYCWKHSGNSREQQRRYRESGYTVLDLDAETIVADYKRIVAMLAGSVGRVDSRGVGGGGWLTVE